ncbi:MAG: MYXO-CTERM sorting domain-containing protein [Minicystis sp.]
MLIRLRAPRAHLRHHHVFAGALAAALFLGASLGQAQVCAGPDDCMAGGFCVASHCCDTACEGACFACRATETGLSDGVCGPRQAGTICKGHCDGNSFTFVEGGKCDAAGACLDVADDPCLHENPCAFDLCGDKGCETVEKLDGTECGVGESCTKGMCGVGTTSASSSSSGTGSGTGGSGSTTGGGGGGGGGTTTGTSSASSSSGSSGVYPPSTVTGCGCRASGEAAGGGLGALIAAAGAAMLRRRRRDARG